MNTKTKWITGIIVVALLVVGGVAFVDPELYRGQLVMQDHTKMEKPAGVPDNVHELCSSRIFVFHESLVRNFPGPFPFTGELVVMRNRFQDLMHPNTGELTVLIEAVDGHQFDGRAIDAQGVEDSMEPLIYGMNNFLGQFSQVSALCAHYGYPHN